MSLIFKDLSFAADRPRTWRNTCQRKQGSQYIQILEGISGNIKAGEMVALMGTSGAGKTTLLDVLARRKTQGQITGTLLHNGEERKTLTNKEAGYVQQSDVALANITVEETLMFAAQLRLAGQLNDDEIRIKVRTIMKELQIDHCANTKVGSTMVRGISGGELRRVSIAQDLINDPQFLFLDEPTSGLDSSSSYEVALVLSKLAKSRNQVIICSIHQPSPQVFALFDKVLLVTKSWSGPTPVGRQVYFGPVSRVQKYFDSYLGLPCPQQMNLADHIVEMAALSQRAHKAKREKENGLTQVEVEEEDQDGESEVRVVLRPSQPEFFPELYQDFCEKYKQSVDYKDLTKSIDQELERVSISNQVALDDDDDCESPYPTSYWNQFLVLSRRTNLDAIRNPIFFGSRILPNHIIGFLVASVYGRLDYSPIDVQNRISAIFFILLCSFMMGNALAPTFITSRPITVRERSSKLYGAWMLLLSTLTSIIPVEVINVSIFITYVYWILNLNANASAFFIFFLINMMMTLWMDIYALMVGSFSTTSEMASAILPLPFLFWMIFGGFFILVEGLPVWWKWAIWISPFYYALSAALYNEFNGVVFNCNATIENCTFADGDQLLAFYAVDLNTSTFWVYVSVLFYAIIISFLILYLSLRFCKWERR